MYKTEFRSIRSYFNEHFYRPTLSAGGLTQGQVTGEEEEQERLFRENLEENQRMAEQRSVRLANERKMLEEDFREMEEKRAEVKDRNRQRAEISVEQETKRCPTFITLETLDTAIEQALMNPTHYDYAIQKNGQVMVEGQLHPYAFKPIDVPETSSPTEELPLTENKEFKFERKVLY
jgi:small subunit ribosomal protein S26